MRNYYGLSVIMFLLFLSSIDNGFSSPDSYLTITGVVRKPMNLSRDDLLGFKDVTVRLNEVTRDRRFRGVFQYRGVPLQYLLRNAHIQKEESGFSKSIDLAIVIRGEDGEKAILSWGEVFYQNPSDAILAFAARPCMPMKKCTSCHNDLKYQRWLEPLKRRIGFPKLILPGDFFTDRCVEKVTNIEVVDLHHGKILKRKKSLYSRRISIADVMKRTVVIESLSSYSPFEVYAKQAGDGKGYHGLRLYRGVSLAEILKRNGIIPDLHSLLVISAPDGYCSVISSGELFLSSLGRNIMIADKADGKPIRESGRFNLILPDDLSADRWVKALERIEILTIPSHPKLCIIGVGCGDTSLITLEAISRMGEANVFICPDDIRERFAYYMGGKPVLFDPLLNMHHCFKKKNPRLSREEVNRLVKELRAKNIKMIRDALSSGKNVAILDYGDPTIYGSWTYWLLDHFKRDEIEVITGISAFNAANAMFRKNVVENGSVVITVPRGLRTNEGMLKAVAEKGDTLAIFIGLKEIKSLLPLFKKYYRSETPVYVVYRAGYSKSQRKIKTTLEGVVDVVERYKEKFLGVIYIGECLK
jgi:precorrin-4 methylase